MNINHEKAADEIITELTTGLAIFVFLAVTVPLVTIWSLNTLFSLGIQYTFWTWLAAFILIPTKGKTLKAILNPKRETKDS